MTQRAAPSLDWYEGIWDAIEVQLRVHTHQATFPWPCACVRCASWLSIRQGLTRWVARDLQAPTRLDAQTFARIHQVRWVRQLHREETL